MNRLITLNSLQILKTTMNGFFKDFDLFISKRKREHVREHKQGE